MQTFLVPSHSHIVYSNYLYDSTSAAEKIDILFQFFQLNCFLSTDLATHKLKHSETDTLIQYLHKATE